jgi:hypothetical protein
MRCVPRSGAHAGRMFNACRMRARRPPAATPAGCAPVITAVKPGSQFPILGELPSMLVQKTGGPAPPGAATPWPERTARKALARSAVSARIGHAFAAGILDVEFT